jgi:hypothetical protein
MLAVGCPSSNIANSTTARGTFKAARAALRIVRGIASIAQNAAIFFIVVPFKNDVLVNGERRHGGDPNDARPSCAEALRSASRPRRESRHCRKQHAFR